MPQRTRTLIFFGVVAITAYGLIYLPRAQSSQFFILLTAAAFSVVTWRTFLRRVQIFGYIRSKIQQIRRLWETYRPLLPQILCGTAFILMCISAYLFSLNAHGGRLQGAAACMVLGGCLFYFAKQPVNLPDASAAPLSDHPRWWLIGLGTLGMLILAEINGQNFGILEKVSFHLQVALLIGSLLALVVGSGIRQMPHSLRHEALPILAITILGLILRLYHLNSTVRLFVDEVLFSNGLMRYWYDRHVPILHWINGNAPFPQVFTYAQAWGVEIFGRDYFGLRFASAILGTLAIPALYGLARTFFDRPTAILSALLLATFPPHVHFSRLGINNIADALTCTLALAFWARAVLHNRRSDYILAGLCLGLTQYFYEGARLMFPPLILIWLIVGCVVWRPRPNLKGILLAGLIALIVGLPIYYTLLSTDAPLMPRFDSSGSSRDYLDRFTDPFRRDVYLHYYLQRAFLLYVQIRDDSLYYMGEKPLLLSFVIPFFLLGAAFAVKQWRKPQNFLVLWILATTLGNTLMQNSVFATRYVGVMPLLMLFTALGIRYSPPIFTQRYHYALTGVLVTLIAFGQVNYYFNEHLPLYNRQIRFRVDAADAVFRASKLPPSTQVFIIGEPNELYHRSIMRFFTDDIELRTRLRQNLTARFLQGLNRNLDFAFFLQPGDRAGLWLLQKYFTLEPPAYTPNPDVTPDRAYVLYYARHDAPRKEMR